MTKFMLSVYGPAERTPFGNYPSKEAMLEAFADTGAFNEMLEREGYFVYADERAFLARRRDSAPKTRNSPNPEGFGLSPMS